MPYTFKANKLHAKDPNGIGYLPQNVVTEASTEEQLEAIRITGQAVLDSIPDNYEDLNDEVRSLSALSIAANSELNKQVSNLEVSTEELRSIVHSNEIVTLNHELDIDELKADVLFNRSVIESVGVNNAVRHIHDQDGDEIFAEDLSGLESESYALKTDSDLSDPVLPANAKSVGDKLKNLSIELQSSSEIDIAANSELNKQVSNLEVSTEELRSIVHSNEIVTLNHELDIDELKADVLFNRSVIESVGVNNAVRHIHDQDGDTILSEYSDTIDSVSYALETDLDLEDAVLPANAKSVGDKLKEMKSYYDNEIREIRKRYEFDAEQYEIDALRLFGDVSTMTKKNKVSLNYEFRNNFGTCTCKWQGSSSLRYPKKNYTITFDRKFEAKSGWGEQKKYCLKANWVDFSHSRNICSARLWGQIVASRAYNATSVLDEYGNEILDTSFDPVTAVGDGALSSPNGGAIDGFPIRLYINDEYAGLYTFNIPKDGWMLNMGRGEHEAILCAEHGTNAVKMTDATDLKCDESDFSIEYITDEDDVEWMIESLKTAIDKVAKSSDSNKFIDEIKGYINLDSAIDYYIYSCLINNYDGQVRNFLLYTYDGVEWFFGAYDLDTTFGNENTGASYKPIWTGSQDVSETWFGNVTVATFGSYYVNKLFKRIHDHAPEMLKARYNELVSGIMSEANVANVFENFAIGFPKALKDREVIIWPTIPGTNTNNLSQILNYYRLKFNAIGAEMESL